MNEDELTEEDVMRYLEECNESQDIHGFCYIPAIVCSKILDLYQKEKEKNKEWERKWNEEKFLINLAENELLGYMKGYEDGFYHKSTAIQQIIKGRESEMHQLEIERLKNKISQLIRKNEELEKLLEENNEM